MRRHTTVSVICPFVIFIISSSPCTALTTGSHQNSCYLLQDSLEDVYFAQVDLIRRGIPTRIVQSEFTWAINYFLYVKPSFRTSQLEHTCIHSYTWNFVFGGSYRSVFVLLYLQDISIKFPNISFLSFEEYPTLPPMSQSEHDLVQTMWATTLVRLEGTPRSQYAVSDFPFPKNIDVLYDPNRDQACVQYNKFRIGSMYNSTEETDSDYVLVALSLISLNLYKRGGITEAIVQLLRHFVGYVFDGVRCLRVEGANIKIPNTLVEAYSRNIGMIVSNATHACQDCSIITPAAVNHVFKDEIQSLLSYNSWGHLQYAILSTYSYLPMKIDFATKIFGTSEYSFLLYYSTYPELISSQRHLEDSDPPQTNEKLSSVERNLVQNITCSDGYVLMPRQENVTDPLKHCCNNMCYKWSELLQIHVAFSAEDCCSRCNQVNHCDSQITSEDLTVDELYSFFIPEYGEQDQIDLHLVVL